MPNFTGVRELIVVTDEAAGPSVGGTPGSAVSVDLGALAGVLEAAGATMVPLFEASESARVATSAEGEPDGDGDGDGDRDRGRAGAWRCAALSSYRRVLAPDERLDPLCEQLRGLPGVLAAYVKEPAEPAWYACGGESRGEVPSGNTPDFTPRQGYLGPSPGGVDARLAWQAPGGAGAGVKIIDIEGAWRFTHEDLSENKGGVVGGAPVDDLLWRNHGTAVIGVIGGDRNGFGVTGICPEAHLSAVSIFGGTGSAGAIVQAAMKLGPGDILLIELHRSGPRARGGGQQGYIPIEWWPDDLDAVRFATRRGVIVVSAGGNGAEDLDHPGYDTPARGFPASWRNPFRRGEHDSGSILVGAGAPPPGTHGAKHGPDRSRLEFSNHGSALDAQGWGREVTTCGYSDLQGGKSEDGWYTDTFAGTSSASPIVVGALGCLQGFLKATKRPPLTPATARALLRSTGAAQADAPDRPSTQRIGSRPDLRQALQRLQGKAAPGASQERPAEAPGETAAAQAAWRAASGRLVALTRGPLVSLIQRRMAPAHPELQEKLAALLATALGEALLAGVLSVGLSTVPGAAAAPAQRLSRELRVAALSGLTADLVAALGEVLRRSSWPSA
jgi:hypothetical protein